MKIKTLKAHGSVCGGVVEVEVVVDRISPFAPLFTRLLNPRMHVTMGHCSHLDLSYHGNHLRALSFSITKPTSHSFKTDYLSTLPDLLL